MSTVGSQQRFWSIPVINQVHCWRRTNKNAKVSVGEAKTPALLTLHAADNDEKDEGATKCFGAIQNGMTDTLEYMMKPCLTTWRQLQPYHSACTGQKHGCKTQSFVRAGCNATPPSKTTTTLQKQRKKNHNMENLKLKTGNRPPQKATTNRKGPHYYYYYEMGRLTRSITPTCCSQ